MLQSPSTNRSDRRLAEFLNLNDVGVSGASHFSDDAIAHDGNGCNQRNTCGMGEERVVCYSNAYRHHNNRVRFLYELPFLPCLVYVGCFQEHFTYHTSLGNVHLLHSLPASPSTDAFEGRCAMDMGEPVHTRN